MAEKRRSSGTGSKDIKVPTSTEIQVDSRPAGERIEGTWINERGEVCVGSKCFTLAIKPNSDEVTVRVDRNECGADLEPIIDEMFKIIGKGGKTVYESTSKIKK